MQAKNDLIKNPIGYLYTDIENTWMDAVLESSSVKRVCTSICIAVMYGDLVIGISLYTYIYQGVLLVYVVTGYCAAS